MNNLPTTYNWSKLLDSLDVGEEHQLSLIHRPSVATAITKKKLKKFVTRKVDSKIFIVRRES